MKNSVQLENSIRAALVNFKRRLDQQRLFQIQNLLLKAIYQEIKQSQYCNSSIIQNLSLEYEDFYQKLRGSGRSYENIVNEKSLVDTYSALENFLFDCFYTLYKLFPKYLGTEVTISVSDLFIHENLEMCKKNFIENKVKSIIQSNNILAILNLLKKDFGLNITLDENDKFTLYEISLIRNVVIHNNSIINRIYIDQVQKFLKESVKYPFSEGETVLGQIEDVLDDLKSISINVCEKIASKIVDDCMRLEKYHDSK